MPLLKIRSRNDRTRPLSATALAAFCAGTVAFLVFRDLFIPHVRDTEVWFGLEVHGSAAWFSAPIHWSIFAFGAWGFWSQYPRIYALASTYAFYIAASHAIWNITSSSGGGLLAGLWQAGIFAIPGFLLGLGARAEYDPR